MTNGLIKFQYNLDKNPSLIQPIKTQTKAVINRKTQLVHLSTKTI